MVKRLRLRESGLAWQAVEGEVIALDIPSAQYLGANPTGSLLWDALGAGASQEELVALLLDRYPVERSAAERDVSAFVAQLHDLGLITEGEPRSADPEHQPAPEAGPGRRSEHRSEREQP